MAALETVKTVKNAVLYKDASGQLLIRLDNVRLSYPFVGTPSDDEDDNGNKSKKWRLVAMLPKATHTEAKDLCKEVIQKLIKENDAKVPVDKWFLGNGDDKEDENMHGHFLVSASDGRIRPKARDRKGNVIDEIEKIDEIFYGGVWAHVLIRPWFFSGKTKNSTKTFPKRISAGLNSVMFAKDDKPFGSGRIDDSDVWEGAARDDDGDDGMGSGDEDDI
jgi:hypothetical protein